MKTKSRHVKRTTKKRRLKYKNIFLFLGVVGLVGLGIFLIFQVAITNIYITNTRYLTDQEIIEYAGLSDYPKLINTFSVSLKKKLKQHPLIKSVKITKKMFTNIYLDITENRPLFYDSNQNKTILLDGSTYEQEFNVPYLINYIPDTIYPNFYKNMMLVYPEVLDRISEIKYDPNDVDDERFLLLMNDGNYVYVTISKFTSINNYLDIVKKFGNKKGILYLDSGEYFKVL